VSLTPVPQRDIYHQAVRNALSKEGWIITHDPLTVPFGLRRVYLDLGAEQLLAAERGPDRIAVEVIFDDAQGHYEVMHAGWVGDRRVHGSALHVDLVNAPDQRKHTKFATA